MPENTHTTRNDRKETDAPKPVSSIEEANRETHENVEQRERELRERLRGAQTDDYDGKRPVITPWLLIRYKELDLGGRPIPDGKAFWRSPDIWIESSDPLGNAVAGEQNFVHARVFNLGAFPANAVRVDFYWADPSVGLNAAAMHHIGTEWAAVNSLTAIDVRCSTAWVPEFVNNGHECLLVHCSDPILDPLLAPFSPKADRHVGQRNITVVEVLPGRMFSLNVAVQNALAHAALTTVTVGNRRISLAKGLDRGALRATTRVLEEAATQTVNAAGHFLRPAGPAVKATFSPTPQFLPPLIAVEPTITATSGAGGANRATAARVHPSMSADLSNRLGAGRTAVVGELELAPHEVRTLSVEMAAPPDARSGDVLVIDLEQFSDGQLVGGYSVVAHVIDDAGPRTGGKKTTEVRARKQKGGTAREER